MRLIKPGLEIVRIAVSQSINETSNNKTEPMKILKPCFIGSVLLIGTTFAFAQPVAQGTYNFYTYIAVAAPNGITWTDAEAEATAMGGQLASITSAAQDQFIYSLAASNNSLWAAWTGGAIGPWLGGYRNSVAPPTGYQWDDGAVFSYSNWASGEPNDFGGNEYYIQYFAGSGFSMEDQWNDAPNDTTGDSNHTGVPNPHGYIVEIVPEASQVNLFLLGALSLVVRHCVRQPRNPAR